MPLARWFHQIRHGAASLLHRSQAETDLNDELRDHLEQEIAGNISAGMSAEEARHAALRLIGGMEQVREECRDRRGLAPFENLVRDLRYAVRMLRRTPIFAAVAVITLAIAIGANTTVFTFVENVVLRSLPIRDPQRVVAVNWGGLANISYPNYIDLRDRNHVFSDLVAYHFVPVSMSARPRDNFRVWGYEVTGNYFRTLGVQPLLGRFLTPREDEKEGAHPVVVISEHCWRSRFASDPRVIGRTVKMNGFPFTIVGVAPASFTGTELIVAADFWSPISMQREIEPGQEWLKWRTSQNAWVMGRLQPGVAPSQAEANLDQIGSQLAREYPADVPKGQRFELTPPGLVGKVVRGTLTSFSLVLTGVAGIGLLLACTNLAGMLLARASDRRREVGIRLALGAGRSRLLRQLMTESLLLAGCGAMLGLGLAYAACDLLGAWQPGFDIPINVALRPDPAVLWFTLATGLVTSVLFGLTPALQTLRVDLVPGLKNEPISRRLRHWSVRDVLVTGQIALSVVLVICSVLVVRSLRHASSLRLGFQPGGAASVSFDLGLKGYDEARMRVFQEKLLARANALPGIQSAAAINTMPLRMNGADSEYVWRAERPLPEPAQRMVAMLYNASPGYLHTAGTNLLAGRDIDSGDRAGSPVVALINEALSHALFGNESPLGRQIRVSSVSGALQVVGMVETGKYQSLSEDPRPALFVPMSQVEVRGTTLVARSPLPPGQVTALLHKAVLDLDPEITLFSEGGLEEQLALPMVGARMSAIALGAFGVFAMALAATGLFALMSYAVARRRRDIAIRMALGARPAGVLSSVLGRTLLLCAAGISIGTVATLAVSRLLSAVLYGVSPRDPFTYATSTLLMVVVAFLAAWTPALRAIHTDPVRALREE